MGEGVMNGLGKIGVSMLAAMTAGALASADEYVFDLTPLPIESAIALPTIANPLDEIAARQNTALLGSDAAASSGMILSAESFRESTRLESLDNWQYQFTLRSLAANPLTDQVERFEFAAGSKWGFTLGFDNDRSSLFDPGQVSAGAFYRVSPRIRIGGELNFTESKDSLVLDSTPVGEENAELKLESAFRF
jgi:hypothetical protein